MKKPYLALPSAETKTPETITIQVTEVPQSREVEVHQLRQNDPDRIAERNAGIGAPLVAHEFRTQEQRAAEAAEQARFDAFVRGDSQ